MMKNSVLVSVIVPVFNREAILAETVNSVLRQTYSDLELLLVDDGSTDRSLEIAESFALTDKRVKVIQRQRQPGGAQVCRNLGLEAAAGEFIIFLDSDDLLLSNALEKRVEAFTNNPSIDLIVFPSVFFTDSIRDANTWWNVFDDRNDLDRFLLQDVVWQTAGPTWKKKFLLDNELRFNENAKTSQDWEFHLRALMLSPSVQKINSPDSFIRRNKLHHTISSKHFSDSNQLNRISLVISILRSMRNTKFYKKSALLTSKLVEEFLMRLNSGKIPPIAEVTEFFDEAKKLEPGIGPRIRFVVNGSKLMRVNILLYKIYRRLYYKKVFLRPLYAPSKYRTPMNSGEISDLNKRIDKA